MSRAPLGEKHSWQRVRMRVVAALATMVALWSAPAAEAGYEPVGTFGTSGEAALRGTGGAVGEANGDLYVADGFNSRVARFAVSGEFLGAWGWNVTATGPDKAGVDQVEKITVRATSGELTFVFSLGGKTEKTSPLEFKGEKGPSAEEVASALNALEGIKFEGGEVEVTGGPGDKTGSKPYVITHKGARGDAPDAFVHAESVDLAGGEPTTATFTELVAEGEAAFEDCIKANGDVCRQSSFSKGDGEGQFDIPNAVAVDQASGDVYVLDKVEHSGGLIQVFTAEGQKTSIPPFGERGNTPLGAGEPQKIRTPLSIAVDTSGTVYVGDSGATTGTGEFRVLIFRLKGGRYAYEEEIPLTLAPENVAVDSKGDLFVSSEAELARINLAKPTEPVCRSSRFALLEGMALDEATLEPFIYERNASTFYRFSAQCASLHEFLNPVQRARHTGLAFDATRSFSAGRPSGILYALTEDLIFAPAIATPPKLVSESVSEIGRSSARLDAQIQTRGNATTYRARYFSSEDPRCPSQAEECEAPAGGGVLGVGGERVAILLSGLVPGATYHYTLSGESHCNEEEPLEECSLEGAITREFTTFASSAGLPDGRAYELVSPPSKDGGNVYPPNAAFPDGPCGEECLPGFYNERFPTQSSPDGNAVAYEGDAFAITGGAGAENEYLATRSPTDWTTTDPSPPLLRKSTGTGGRGYQAVSADLGNAVLQQEFPALLPEPEAPAGVENVYAEDMTTGVVHALVTQPPMHRAPGRNGEFNAFAARFAGASADFAHIIFSANDALIQGSGTLETELNENAEKSQDGYLYDSTGGHTNLVDVLPELEGGKVAPNAIFDAISSDGDRIYWTYAGHLYARLHGETSIGPAPDANALLAASADGARVLFADGLIYQINEAAGDFEQIADLTEAEDHHDGGFEGILGNSSDLSTVYYVDSEVLTREENGHHETAQRGAHNLYVYHEDEGAIGFIGVLSTADDFTGTAVGTTEPSRTGDWATSPASRSAEVTPSGRYLTFMSGEPLTGYNAGTFEVFLYDLASKQLSCASCNPTGEPPVGDSSLTTGHQTGGSEAKAVPSPPNLAEDGRVFFNSFDRLSPEDKNGLQNVYEYEPDGFHAPDGLGACTRPAGCILMLSSGTSDTDSQLLTASPSGGDVFFVTRAQLVPQDKDQLMDLYDAREPHVPGEQVELPIEPAAKECASAEECKLPAAPAPEALTATISSTALSGLGNLTPPQPAPPPPPKAETKLQKELKACHMYKLKRKRRACEARAKKRSGQKASRGVKHAKGKSTRAPQKHR